VAHPAGRDQGPISRATAGTRVGPVGSEVGHGCHGDSQCRDGRRCRRRRRGRHARALGGGGDGGKCGPGRAAGGVHRSRRRRHRLRDPGDTRDGVPGRVDHQDVHRHSGCAAVGAGAGGPRRSSRHVPQELPPRACPARHRSADPAAAAHAHLRYCRADQPERAGAALVRRDRQGRAAGPATGDDLSGRSQGDGTAGHAVAVHRPRFRHARADRRGRHRSTAGCLPGRPRLRAFGHDGHN
jgi:hypothetical protein